MSDHQIGLSAVGLSRISQKSAGSRKRRRGVATAVISAIALVDCTSHLLGATTTSTWTGISNNVWNNAANWNPAAEYPNNGNNSISDFSVVITAAGSLVNVPNLNINATIDALNVAALATLDINGNNSLTLNSTLTNNGQIVVNNNQSYPATLTATGTIGGSGSIVLDTTNSADMAGTFTNGSSQTIEGTGVIEAMLTNNGTVDASSANAVLDLQSDNMTNNLTMEATGAGTLSINGITVTQGSSGKISASNGVVDLSSATIATGTLTTSAGGTIQTTSTTSALTGPITNSGTFYVTGDTNLNVTGNLTNNGTITVNNNQYYSSTLNFSGTTLSGTGTLLLDSGGTSALVTGSLTQSSGHTISGQGEIGAALINNSTVDANSSGNTLVLASSNMTNNSTFEATAGGILEISGITVTQGTSGTIIASNSTVDFSNAGNLVGGTLTTSGANGSIDIASSGTSNFTGPITNSGVLNINGDNNLDVTGNLTDNGTITLNNNQYYSSTLTFTSSTLSGTGSLLLNSGGTSAVVAGTLVQSSGHTTYGSGDILATLTNNGLVDATAVPGVNTLIVSGASVTNTATMEATTGVLEFSNGVAVTNTGGSINATGNTVLLNGATITGGTLNATSPNAIEVGSGGGATFGALTISAGTTVNIDGTNILTLTGASLTNNGTLVVNDNQYYASTLQVNANTLLTGTGSVVLDGGTGAIITTGTNDTLTVDTHQTISGYGIIAASLINNGTVNSNVNNGTITLQNSGMTNNSLMEATGGGTLLISGITVMESSAGQISASNGTVDLSGATISGGTLKTSSGGVIQNTNGTSTLSGVTNTGTLNINGDTNLNTTGNFVNNGVVTVDQNTYYYSTLATTGPISGTGILAIYNGGSVKIGTGTGQSSQGSLSISQYGQLDITNNHMYINYGSGSDPMTTIYGYLLSGYDAGNWNGDGIISSTAAGENSTNGALKYGIGWADGKDKIVTGISSGTIELKYTLLGDANLDGTVNGSDFSILAANFGLGVTNWDQGNFLFSTSVNGSDFSALAANFGQGDSGADASVTPADIAALDAFAVANGLPLPTFAAVPEPASVMGAVVCGSMLLARRRRSRLN
jgi:hypothetical protein